MAQWAAEGNCLSGGYDGDDVLYASYQMSGYYIAPSIGGVGGDEGQQTSGGSIIGSAIVRGVNGP